MERKELSFIPTTHKTEDVEEGKYTTIFTEVGNIEVLKPLDEVMEEIKECKEKGELFRYKRLDEYSQTMKKYGEFVVDLNNTKILGYKEHHVIDDLKKQRELNAEKAKQ